MAMNALCQMSIDHYTADDKSWAVDILKPGTTTQLYFTVFHLTDYTLSLLLTPNAEAFNVT